MHGCIQWASRRPRGAIALLAIAALITACSDGEQATVALPSITISGSVPSDVAERATVCLDANRNGRCDAGESRSRTNAQGGYELQVPSGSKLPIVAEVEGVGTGPQAAKPYRMASPAYGYATAITPYTTLVHLSAESQFALAEDLVREVLGLRARFSLLMDPAASPTALSHTVAKHVVDALQASDGTLDWSASDALARLAEAFPAALTTLPTLTITTRNAAPIVSKVDYLDAVYVLTNPAASPQTVTLNGKIRGRGNSTWGQPKNPYKIQFANDATYGELPDILGMKKNRNWALLADWFDRSLMRNKLAYALGNSMVFSDGLKWTPTGLHVEVYLNGDYIGVYLLNEDVRLDANRLNIKKMSSSASVNDVDGGYIFEADWPLDCYNAGAINLQFISARGTHVCIDTPDESAITANQLAYARNLLSAVEGDLISHSKSARINPVSWADFYLLSEFFKNNDAPFNSSVKMWKDTDAAASPADRLLNLGPLWDFDISAGNFNDHDNWASAGCWVSKGNRDINWFVPLFNDPEFVALVVARWKHKRPELERFIRTSIDTYARRLRQAQARNFQRWPILGIPLSSHYAWQTWEEEVTFLRAFLTERLAWMDRAFATPDSFAEMCK